MIAGFFSCWGQKSPSLGRRTHRLVCPTRPAHPNCPHPNAAPGIIATLINRGNLELIGSDLYLINNYLQYLLCVYVYNCDCDRKLAVASGTEIRRPQQAE